jgi:hypothetical protein
MAERDTFELINDGDQLNEGYFNGIHSSFNNPFIGVGTDGDVVISANTTLTRVYEYNNLTINPGVIVTINQSVIKVKGTLTNNGIIRSNGANGPATGSNKQGGVGGGNIFLFCTNIVGTGSIEANGGNGVTVTANTGVSGNNAILLTSELLNTGGGVGSSPGGVGGAPRAGAAGGAGGIEYLEKPIHSTIQNNLDYSVTSKILTANGGAGIIGASSGGSAQTVPGSGGGAGGGMLFAKGGDGGAGGPGTGNSASASGGASGSGGGAGGLVVVFANNTLSSTISITATGGAGGNGNNPTNANFGKGGGGGGGAGGTLVVFAKQPFAGTTNLSGGVGGITPVGGLGNDGEDGEDGEDGSVIFIKI